MARMAWESADPRPYFRLLNFWLKRSEGRFQNVLCEPWLKEVQFPASVLREGALLDTDLSKQQITKGAGSTSKSPHPELILI